MIKIKVLEIPVTTMLTILGTGLVFFLFLITIIGLFGGVLKELFYYISSSQGFSTKTTSADTEPASVLVTQE